MSVSVVHRTSLGSEFHAAGPAGVAELRHARQTSYDVILGIMTTIKGYLPTRVTCNCGSQNAVGYQ